MKLESCKKCNKLFDDIIGHGICPECRFSKSGTENIEGTNSISKERLKANLRSKEDKEDHKYDELKKYVLSHSKATILDISVALKISPSLILRWIREDKLEFSDDSKDAWFDCECCGVKIKSGKVCISCRSKKIH